MEIETVGQLQVYLLLKKADLLEYFTKRKFERILWFLPLPGGHLKFLVSPVFSIRAFPKFGVRANTSGIGGPGSGCSRGWTIAFERPGQPWNLIFIFYFSNIDWW